LWLAASQAAEIGLRVILSEAKNLSVHWTSREERFFASLRITPKIGLLRSPFNRDIKLPGKTGLQPLNFYRSRMAGFSSPAQRQGLKPLLSGS
jgi:hypothetical protein